MKRRSITLILLLLIFIFSTSTVSVSAVTIDNDGQARDNPYGDSKLGNVYVGSSYVDCYIPYKLTCKDIGGYALSGTELPNKVTDSAITGMSKNIRNNPVATSVMLECSYSYAQSHWSSLVKMGNPKGFKVTVDSETSLNIMTDANGNQYYLTAVQPFFYNHDKSGKDGFPKSASNARSQVFDVILTDGTCIHFVCMDINASQHTNGKADSGEGRFDGTYNNSKLNYSQYNNLFQAQNGNTLEVWGKGYAAPTGFCKKFNFGPGKGKNKIAYYRMYNKNVEDSPKRASGVGKKPYFSYGNVTIANSNGTKVTGNGSIVDEWNLVGMPENTRFDDIDVVMPTYEDLSSGEQYSINIVNENLELDEEYSMYDFIRVLVSFIGLLTMLYGVLLFVGYLFDRTNNVVEISMVSILTLGKLTFSDEDEKATSKGYLTSGRMLKVSGMCLLIGMFLVSGSMFSWIERVVYWATTKGII